MRYRGEIAGLRAVAIIPILLFHGGMTVLSGGFIGVDVFFVISGFLITSIIQSDISANTFSFLEFYRRRAARIFPALIAVIAAVLVAGAFLMLPEELKAAGNSSAAAAAFISNLYFLKTTDYFGGSAELKPLLHTWSLGIEEQFYLFYPVFMYFLSKFLPSKKIVALLTLVCLSFCAGLLMQHFKPAWHFYLLPTRAWELGLGGLVALGAMPKVGSSTSRNGLALAGAGLIILGLFLIRANDPFPAPWALLPCIGTCLIIAYGEQTSVGRALSLSPIKWIGDISYSLYLWHWPIITFYRLETGLELSGVETIALTAASIAAATVSHALIEKPFMNRLRKGQAGPIAFGGVVALAATGLIALLVAANADHFRRLDPEVQRVAAYSNYRDTKSYTDQFRRGVCFIGTGDAAQIAPSCLKVSATKENVVVIGDSHAAQYWRAIEERFPKQNIMQATASGCRPIIGASGAKACTNMVKATFASIFSNRNVKKVILGGRWKSDEIEPLVQTVRALTAHGVSVTVIGPTVEYEGELPSLLARSIQQGNIVGLGKMRVSERGTLDRQMKPLITAAGAHYVSAYAIECPKDECRVFDAEGGPLQFDYGHLTLTGAREIVSQFPEL